MEREESKLEVFDPKKYQLDHFEENQFYLMCDDKGQFSMKDSWVVGIFGSYKNNSMFSACSLPDEDYFCDNILTVKGDFFNLKTCMSLDKVLETVEIFSAREVHCCGDLDKLKFNETYFRFANSPIYNLIDSPISLLNGVKDVEQKVVDGRVKWCQQCYSPEFLVKEVEVDREQVDKVTGYLQNFYGKGRDRVKHFAMKNIMSRELSYVDQINETSVDKMNDKVAEIMNL